MQTGVGWRQQYNMNTVAQYIQFKQKKRRGLVMIMKKLTLRLELMPALQIQFTENPKLFNLHQLEF